MLRLLFNNGNKIINKPPPLPSSSLSSIITTTSKKLNKTPFLYNNINNNNKRLYTTTNNNNSNSKLNIYNYINNVEINNIINDISKIINKDNHNNQNYNIENNNDVNYRREEKEKQINNINFIETINQKEQPEELKRLITNIKKEPTKPLVYFELFIWMVFIGEIPLISKIDGINNDSSMSTIDILVKEIENNPKFKGSYLFILKEMKLKGFDEIEIPTYMIGNGEGDNNSKPFTNVSTNLNSKNTKYKYLHLLLIILDIDKSDPFALDKISDYMIEHQRDPIKFITFLNGEQHTVHSLLVLNFKENSNYLPTSYFKLLQPFIYLGYIPIDERVRFSFEEILCKGLHLFPKVSSFYNHLANIPTHNYHALSIPIIDDPFSSPTNKQMNRIDLMVKAIETLEQNIIDQKLTQPPPNTTLFTEDNLLTTYYHKLGDYLQSNQDTVLINGINHNKITLFSKAIELDLNNDLAIKSLIQCMEPQQKININNQSLTRELLGFKLLNLDIATGCLYLSKIYLQDNNLEKSKEFNDIYLKCKDAFRKQLIENHSKEPLDYHFLAMELKDDDGKIIINGKEMNKFDCLLKSFHLNSNSFQQPFYAHQLSKYLKDNESTIKLLNGLNCNKRALLQHEMVYFDKNTEALYSFYFENHFKINEKDTTNGIPVTGEKKFSLLIKMLSTDLKFTKLYLDIGIFLQQDVNVNDLDVRLFDTNYFENSDKSILKLNRKELFIKYLLLTDPIYPVINNDNKLGWCHLSIELGDDEIQFGKSKKQILLDIIELDDQFSNAYYQLSNLLINNNDEIKLNNGTIFNKIQLLLKAIDLERGNSELKCIFLIGLSKCLSNNKNDKIELLNGKRFDKQQLLIDIYEDYRNDDPKYYIYIFQELSKTFEDENEKFEMKGQLLSKADLLSFVEAIYKDIIANEKSHLYPSQTSSSSPSDSF